MTDPALDSLVPDARAFLTDLAHHNNRDWFNAHKARYETELKHPAQALLQIVATDLERLTEQPVTQKLFRPQRDVRFSKDKTPYHTHLHLLWTTPTDGVPLGWFFGLSPDYISIGGGVMAFDKAGLEAWRGAVDNSDDFTGHISALSRKGARLDPPELKRVPAPYPKDHPRGDLLRRKGLALWFDKTPEDIRKDGLISSIMAAFSELLPVQGALRLLL